MGRGGRSGRRTHKEEARPHLTKVAGGERLWIPSVRQSVSGLTFIDNITGLQCAITARSAFSLRYIMIHAENVIKILW